MPNEVEGPQQTTVREKTVRLFVGIALNDATRKRCAEVAEEVRRTGFQARYELPEKYHITLAFLGNAPAAQLEAVVSALRSLCNIPPLRLSLDRLGGFPHERRPRVLFIGAQNQGRAFSTLAAQARADLTSLGFKLDTDPVAHITIARIKAPQRPLPLIEVQPITVEIAEVSLFESLPHPPNATSRYEIRTSVPLIGLPATPT